MRDIRREQLCSSALMVLNRWGGAYSHGLCCRVVWCVVLWCRVMCWKWSEERVSWQVCKDVCPQLSTGLQGGTQP